MGVDPRYLRRLRWLQKARSVRSSNASLTRHWRFVLLSPEPHNFTFEIANLDELAQWAAAVADSSFDHAQAALDEVARDAVLAARLRAATSGRWWWTTRAPAFGKRLGWYALARMLRPRLVVEVGVDDGLGSLLLLRALERNAAEDHPGRLVSFDVNPAAGWLVDGRSLWDLRIESSSVGLPRLLEQEGELDLFIYDGWHSHAAERADLESAFPRLRPDGVLLSDDSQVTRALPEFCVEHGLELFEFHEIPLEHFHPGAVLAAGRRRRGS
jgi:predicted O-methyltransferase YrrM